MELRLFSLSGTSHPSQFIIHTEIILDSNRSESLGFSFYFYSFLGFNGLMQSVTPSTARHLTASKFINNHDISIFPNNVLFILLKKCISF